MAPSLSPEAIHILKSTAPVVKTEGTKITCRMYEIMFEKYPVVNNLFNTTHIRKTGDTNSVPPQAQALANAVFAYAANADNLGVLGDAVAMMVHKHVSFDVKAEHYGIVGECLLAALKDVLGDAATDEIMAGWKEGYEFLAELLIGLEINLKQEHAAMEGGWMGYKKMLVTKKVKETDDITSFYIQNASGEPLPTFKPGQYISLCIPEGEIEGFNHNVVRNYSLSCKPGEDFYRVSIKREGSNDLLWPDGVVSTYFHDRIDAGAEILVGMPCGTFVLNEDSSRPVVLISGGVGLTPMISMLDHILAKGDNRKVTFVQCAKSANDHPMKRHVDDVTDNDVVTSHVFYSTGGDDGSLKNIKVHCNRITKDCVQEIVPDPLAGHDFYFCGPPTFLGHIRKILTDLKVPQEQMKYEYFGPTQQ